MSYYNKDKKRTIFNPDSKEPFKLSRSKIDLFKQCPRCFYLDNRLGVKRPDTYPLTLNIAVDALLKKEFDIHRAKETAHPMMEKYHIDAVPLKHEDMNTWRELNFGRGGIHYLDKENNLDVYGVVDDIWVTPDGQFHVVDYKATAKKETPTLDGDLGEQYKRQMEVYQWLLRKKGFKVSNVGYFFYVNGKKDALAFDAKLEFDITILPCDGDDSWIEQSLKEIKKCLMSEKSPAAAEDCDYCSYRNRAAAAFQSKIAQNKKPAENTLF